MQSPKSNVEQLCNNYNIRNKISLNLFVISLFSQYYTGLEVFIKSTFFFGVSLEDITTCNNSVKVNLQNALQKGLHEGVVKPLQKATFSFKDEANALK